jgi:two-component system copper resistance phosphate regulon response regulator CusR
MAAGPGAHLPESWSHAEIAGTTMRILLAEDDDRLRSLLARGLREHAYAVDAVADGAAAMSQVAVHDYDAVVLDVLLPERDGLEVCREVRRRGIHVPVLMLTARDAVRDRVAGLDAGADDYLTKPFAFDELLARLRALLRRRGEVLPDTITIADLQVDTRRQLVRRGGRVIPLAAKEYAFIEYLARNSGRVVSRAELAAHVWDDNHDPMSNLIDVYVSRLRRKVDGGEAVALMHVRRGAGILLGADPDGGASGGSAGGSAGAGS